MKFGVIFATFFVVSLTVQAAGGKSVLDSFKELLFPRNPELNRVRRIEDANGDPYAVLDSAGLVEQYGYPAEQHNLTTKDGYNLVFFRIPGSPESPPAEGKPIVFLQHGMLGSSDMFLMIGSDHDLAFLLADAGYDVWIGNIRGNTYCRSNTKLSTMDKEFWGFTWHEAATIDLPSMIDYILEYTGQKNLFYVGISMGTTMSYALLSEMPEYNEKMRLVISLAPVGCWKHMANDVIHFGISWGPLAKKILNSMDIYDVFPQTKTNVMMVEAFCSGESSMQPMCIAGMQLGLPIFFGLPAKGFNYSMLPYFVKYLPAGASFDTLIHFQQCYKSGVLTKFDYGPAENSRRYGMEKPPLYNLSKISAPYVLIYGPTDELAFEKNVVELSKHIPNVVSCEVVPARAFNHMDFMMSPLAKDLVYSRIIELFSKY